MRTKKEIEFDGMRHGAIDHRAWRNILSLKKQQLTVRPNNQAEFKAYPSSVARIDIFLEKSRVMTLLHDDKRDSRLERFFQFGARR